MGPTLSERGGLQLVFPESIDLAGVFIDMRSAVKDGEEEVLAELFC